MSACDVTIRRRITAPTRIGTFHPRISAVLDRDPSILIGPARCSLFPDRDFWLSGVYDEFGLAKDSLALDDNGPQNQ